MGRLFWKEGDGMNARKKLALQHLKELRETQDMLREVANDAIQDLRSRGLNVQPTPQLVRMLSLGEYRARDIQKMEKMMDRSTIQDYLLSYDSSGNVVTGADAVQRAAAGGHAPVHLQNQSDLEMENLTATMEQVDPSLLQLFMDKLDSYMSGYWDENESLTHSPLKGDRGGAYAFSRNMNEFGHGAQIQQALDKAIDTFGYNEVARTFAEHPEVIEALENAALAGYADVAIGSFQQILQILNNGAMTMADMEEIGRYQDEYEAFYDLSLEDYIE